MVDCEERAPRRGTCEQRQADMQEASPADSSPSSPAPGTLGTGGQLVRSGAHKDPDSNPSSTLCPGPQFYECEGV